MRVSVCSSHRFFSSRLIFLAGFFISAAPLITVSAATSPSLSVGSVNGSAGNQVTVPVNFTAGTTGVASLQFVLGLPSGWSFVSASAGTAASNAGKSVSINTSGGTVIVFGLNQTAIASGDVADVVIQIPAGAAGGSFSVPISQPVYSDANGNNVAGGASSNGTVTIPPSAPVINSFTASPTSIVSGQSSTLSFSVTGATSLSIDNGVGSVTGQTSKSVSPTTTTTYTLTATNSGGSTTKTVTVTVTAAAPAINSFSASPTSITSGQSSTLSFSVTGATSLSIDNGVGSVTGQTSKSVSPTTTTTYTLTATNSGGSTTKTVTVTVTAAAPAINSFSASPTSITSGQSSTLSFSVTGATSLSIDNGVGSVTGQTSKSVSPTTTTTYTLTATNSGGSTTKTVTVTVAVSVALSPTTKSLSASQTQTFTATVTGSADTSVTWGISPNVGSLTPGSSTALYTAPSTISSVQTVTISAMSNADTSKTATATVTLNPAAVPVINSFTASPTSITSGQSSTLSFSVTGATSLSIDNSVGSVTGQTSKSVSPTTTTTYTLTATNSGGSTTKTVTVTVTSGATAPSLSVGSASGAAGSQVSLPVTFAAGSTGVAGMQFALTLPSGWTIVSVSTGAASQSAGKSVSFNAGTVIIFGLNQNIVASGVVANVVIQIPASQAAGTVALPITQTVFSDASGNNIAGGTSSNGSVTVTAAPPAPPVINSFTANPTSITSGQSSTLSFSVTGATSLSIDNGVGSVTGQTSKSVSPTTTTTYTLTATNSGGSTTKTVTVTVTAAPPPPPVINSFTANPTSITSGQPSTLSFSVTGATSLSIDNGVGSVTGQTSKSVTPTTTTTYTLTATNSGGSTTATATVTVTVGASAPSLSVGSASGVAGTQVTVPVNFSPGSTGVAGLQFGLTLPSGWTIVSVSTGAASQSAGKSVSFNAMNVIVFGMNQNVIGSGVVATVVIQIPASQAAGTVALPITQTVYTDATGNSVTGGASSNGSVTVTATGAPVVTSFTASPASITSGQPSLLSFSVTGATSLSIDNGVGSVTGLTSRSVTPSTTTTYTLTATNSGGSATKTVTVTVSATPPTLPVINSFTAAPTTITSSQSSTLTFSVTGATQLTIDNGVGVVTGQTSKSVSPTATTIYTLTATNSAGSATKTVTVTVSATTPTLPVINSFTAGPTSIASGRSSTLSFSVTGATQLTISNGVGDVTGLTSKSVSPSVTTLYTLTATNSAGTTTAAAIVTVTAGSGSGAPVLEVGDSTTTAGSLIVIPVSLGGSGTGPAGLQFSLTLPAGWTLVAAPAGSAAEAAGKSVSFNTANGTVIVFGVNQTSMNTGTVAYLLISLPATAVSGRYPLAVTAISFTDANGNSITGNTTATASVMVQNAGSVQLQSAAALSNVRVYPNPWRSDRGIPKNINFDGMTVDNTIKIFTVSGRLVRTLRADANGSAAWDQTNDAGSSVGSGLYIYLITDNHGAKIKGKLAIIR